eukprot:symbB.v1.2.026502.t2/scaffold2653.1/size73901/6
MSGVEAEADEEVQEGPPQGLRSPSRGRRSGDRRSRSPGRNGRWVLRSIAGGFTAMAVYKQRTSRERRSPLPEDPVKESQSADAPDPGPVFASRSGSTGEVQTKVVDGIVTRAGAQTYLSEIYVPRLPPLRPGTICVRGPLRFERDVAEDDCRRLAKAHAEGGYKKVQELRNALRAEAR